MAYRSRNIGAQPGEAGADEVVASRCDHAFVMTPNQSSDPRAIRLFCPRCERTFTVYNDLLMNNPERL